MLRFGRIVERYARCESLHLWQCRVGTQGRELGCISLAGVVGQRRCRREASSGAEALSHPISWIRLQYGHHTSTQVTSGFTKRCNAVPILEGLLVTRMRTAPWLSKATLACLHRTVGRRESSNTYGIIWNWLCEYLTQSAISRR